MNSSTKYYPKIKKAWWYKQLWSYQVFEESVRVVIGTTTWRTNRKKAIYLPFICRHENNKIRKILINKKNFN